MKKLNFAVCLFGAVIFTASLCAASDANRLLAEKYYQNLYSSKYSDAISAYLQDSYKEHQPGVWGPAEYMKKRLAEYPNLTVTIHNVIAQGDYVFLHVEEKLSAEKKMARGELFRLENGKIADHWCAAQEVPPEAAEMMFAKAVITPGSTAAADNNEKLKENLKKTFDNYDLKAAEEGTTERYIQHSPGAPSGLAGFTGFLSMMKEQGVKMTWTPKHTVAEGDILVLQGLYIAEPGGPSHCFDILRVTADGKKDEHWDVCESVKEEDIGKIF